VAVIAVKTQNGYVVQRFGGSFIFFTGKVTFKSMCTTTTDSGRFRKHTCSIFLCILSLLEMRECSF
jgi:hypothetical protein